MNFSVPKLWEEMKGIADHWLPLKYRSPFLDTVVDSMNRSCPSAAIWRCPSCREVVFQHVTNLRKTKCKCGKEFSYKEVKDALRV